MYSYVPSNGTNSTFPYKTQYYKAQAYHIKPLTKQGLFAVDGEAFPFEESIVEVHPGLGTVLSPQGRYAIEFDPSKRHRGPSGV